MTEVNQLTNNGLILLALLLAGGSDGFADIEEVAIWANKLSPQRFGWRTQGFPSDKKVSQAITDLEREDGSFMRRGAGDIASRRLTPAGLKEALRVGQQLSGKHFKDVEDLMSAFTKDAPRELVQVTAPGRRPGQNELRALRRHRTFTHWLNSGDLDGVEAWELADSVNCLPDASSEVLRTEIEALQTWAARWKDDEATAYLEAVSSALTPAPKS